MANVVRVVGVHPVDAEEPVHLLEVELAGDVARFDFGKVTQEMPSQPPENWQVAYDERQIQGDADHARFAFFFHYLDLERPLLTPWGAVTLPAETPAPAYLQAVQYEQP
jgi:hypothetical protein